APDIDDALRRRRDGAVLRVVDVPLSARAAFFAAAIEVHPGPVLLVTARNDRADSLYGAISELLPSNRTAHPWPTPEALPYEQLPFDLTAATLRVSLLNTLLENDSEHPPVVIASVRGIAHLVLSPDELRSHTRRLRVGDRLNADAFIRWASETGYQVSPLVQEPGSIAKRGGIVDVFPPSCDLPVRIDLFGDEIESIRTFNPSTQRSDHRLSSITLLPPVDLPLWRLKDAAARIRSLDLGGLRREVRDEWERTIERLDVGAVPSSIDLFAPFLSPSASTSLDYLPASTLVIVDEPDAVERSAEQLERYADELVAGFVANGELPPGLPRPFAAWSGLTRGLALDARIEIGSAFGDAAPAVSISSVSDAPLYSGRMSQVVEAVDDRLRDGWRVAIATDQVERLTEIFEERGVFPRRDKRGGRDDPSPLEEGVLDIVASDLDGGWMIESERLLVLSDLELFGFRKQTRRGTRKFVSDQIAFANSLTPAEFVVHIDHGIARFVGLTRLDTAGVEREYLLLEYAKGDKLYVPVDQSDRVTRYSGGGLEPTPTKLGSGEWVRTKQRVRRAVREMAFELIQLYAARETIKASPFGADTTWDGELAESFPYTETGDQQKAIADVRADLESTKPMDRLICGDVGFGKTEVALRAAFKAVNGGRQVAVLVPTTVLALQHFQTFGQRLAAFPIRVEMLSRLRDKREQRTVVGGLADGSVDIVIGTHRLVQRDVKFKALGLVVVDEEQRFGVRQKEFLKQLRTEVDVLTMSATPIPRTLHLSLAGIRDISVIDTAPQARLPIRTFVTSYSENLFREVILREIERGGQVYVVQNRVHSIDALTHKLRQNIPEARFGVGHGQMDEEVLEEVILAFVRHEYDVLVCTTIIESGIDIPNVNTIVIDDADRFGLTQLYQLRGRVGRSTNRAYAYLLTRPGKVLSGEAQARLDAIQEATELGAGLRVAMRDMEIRGAGNILGAEQSGHIGEIGFDLYIRLLSQAVEEVRAGRPREEPNPVTLDLPLTALLPASYITDMELRLSTYRRIASVASARELTEARAELEDRFGPIPLEVEHLFALIALRLRCAELGIDSMVEREREIVIRPVVTAEIDGRKLLRRLGQAVKLTPNSVRLRLPELQDSWQDALDLILDAVEAAPAARETRPAAMIS
ncbi:MAG: transcription-repair coupling factor, partial [Thermomicrobiales bacterium]